MPRWSCGILKIFVLDSPFISTICFSLSRTTSRAIISYFLNNFWHSYLDAPARPMIMVANDFARKGRALYDSDRMFDECLVVVKYYCLMAIKHRIPNMSPLMSFVESYRHLIFYFIFYFIFSYF